MPNPYAGRMECPHCNESTKTVVLDSRRRRDGDPGIRRRRRCQQCQGLFTTFEVVATRLAHTYKWRVEDESAASQRLRSLELILAEVQALLDKAP